MLKRLKLLLAAIVLLSLSAGCVGEPPVSDKDSITLVIPYVTEGSGASINTIGRLLGAHLEETLGVRIQVLSADTPYSGGWKGILRLLGAAPDGKTLLLAAGYHFTIGSQTQSDFDPFDLTFIASTHESALGRFVRADSQFNTLEDLIAFGQVEGNRVPEVQNGIGFIASHLLSEAVGGFNYLDLPIDGHVDSVAYLAEDIYYVKMAHGSVAEALPFLEAGLVRPLLIESENWPDNLVPSGVPTSGDVPSTKDLYGYSVTESALLLAPPGLPEETRIRLEQAVEAALADPQVFEEMSKTGEIIRFMSGAQARTYTKQVADMYTPVLEYFGYLE
ncbi:MAG: tripartite tricarboxylate transporter substrate-binding protein [Propionibacteriaceae bacterium]|nr:tripartite tricarboxylate transporter substrate-binding protein [Propionibacteriaceae bacterium]